jgi:hypothetical protein
MKEIYYERDGKQIGPLPIDNVQQLHITGDTLVWFEGLPNWTKAKEIPELSSYIKATPPPLPSRQQIITEEKYDLTYKRETDASITGFIFLFVPVFFKLTGFLDFQDEQSYRTAQITFAVVNLIYRILITFWVTSIAKRQNRDTLGWGAFTFFLPTIALITIGFLKRLKKEGQPTFAELTTPQLKTEEQIKIEEKKFKQDDQLLKTIAFGLMILGLIGVILLFVFG